MAYEATLAPSEFELPGMWEYADFLSGEPQEKHAFWGMDPSGICSCSGCKGDS